MTGKQHTSIPKESPRKTSLKLDKANVRLRRYRIIKGRHQCTDSKLSEVRSSLNCCANDVQALLAKLLEKYTCSTPTRVKVSVDDHDPSRNVKAVTFSFSLVCEPASQCSANIVPVLSIPGSEYYDLMVEARAWHLIESELVPEVLVGERLVQVDYFLCADLKSILLNLRYKSANARDVCIYRTCKNRWELCCKDGKCRVRYVEKPNGSFHLPTLKPSDAGYKRPPLVNLGLYKFVITDILHAYLRITDQFCL